MTRMTQLFRNGSQRLKSRLWTNRMARYHTPPEAETISRPRIVILSASVGAGHIRAAQAIESALSQMLPDATIAHVDVLKLTNGAFRRAYAAGYFRAVARCPNLVGMMYDMLDHPGDASPANKARIAVERMNFTRLTQFLTSQPWDLAINTHFLPPELIAWMRRRAQIDLPQVTVVTDFDVHGMWLNDPCEGYFVATEEARANAIAWGIDPANVEVTGIPIDPVFSQPVKVEDVQLKHGLVGGRPMVLQLAGGFGAGSIERIYKSIRDIHMPLQIVVVTGNNAEARRRLESMPPHARHACRILGFTTDMHELMAAADVVVSKPGGLTTSESLARGCAMVVVEPIPGQEDRNSDFLLENGCAIKVNNLSSLTLKLGSLLSDHARLLAMRRSALECAKPYAAWDVAAACVQRISMTKPQ